jgi:hypothetical protein
MVVELMGMGMVVDLVVVVMPRRGLMVVVGGEIRDGMEIDEDERGFSGGLAAEEEEVG